MKPVPRLREEPLFFDAFAEPWQKGAVAAPAVELARDLDVQVVSRYADGHGCTLVAGLPRGWSGVERAIDGTLEVLVLEGELTVPGRMVGSGGFVQIPKGSGPVALSSGTGARVMLFWHATLPVVFRDGWRVTSAWDEPWELTVLDGFPAGAMHRSLRVPDIQGATAAGSEAGLLRLTMLGPGFAFTDMERHTCWEEDILLRGDMLIMDEGVFRPGSMNSHPPEWWHGPMGTKGGALFVVHCDGPIDLALRPHAGAAETLHAYLESAPWA